MTQNFDFLDIIRGYSLKNNSPYIPVNQLVSLLQKNALRGNAPPQARHWMENTQEKVYAELARLSDEQKCIIQGSPQNQRIFFPNFFVEKLETLYFNIDKTADRAFPCENDLSAVIPAEYTRKIFVDNGMIDYLAEPQASVLPILKFVFPEKFGCLLALSIHFPRRILEIALSKVKMSMQHTGSIDFYRQKLITHFSGQEISARNFFENFMMHQQVCLDDIEKSNDFTFSAWLFLCPLIKMQVADSIERNGEISPEDIGLYQSISVIYIFNNYYKVIAVNRYNKEKAFSLIHEKIGLPPYLFTFSEIYNFTGIGGFQILGRCTENDLMEWLKQKMTVHENDLPAILKFSGMDGKDNFVRKDRIFALCSYLLKDLQSKIKDETTNRWVKLLRGYFKEKAMENDSYFEDLVTRETRLYSPFLLNLLHDKQVALLQAETQRASYDTSKVEKFFVNGNMIPLRKLMNLKREDILRTSKLMLPFWYSIPGVAVLGRIIKHGFNKENAYFKESEKQAASLYTTNIKKSAEKLSKELVPNDTDIDEYMNSILDRWNQILNYSGREKLTRDVNATVKDYMRNAIKNFGQRALSATMLDELAERVIMSNQALSKIKNRNSLRLYIKLFTTKILLNS
ncbi:MAG: hypothetical protein LBF80_05265 [Spirochaetaceae bacterium]|jgi:hypothetical protein|nr:hypothetical protein [Spirochaetaceae bacterium]